MARTGRRAEALELAVEGGDAQRESWEETLEEKRRRKNMVGRGATRGTEKVAPAEGEAKFKTAREGDEEKRGQKVRQRRCTKREESPP